MPTTRPRFPLGGEMADVNSGLRIIRLTLGHRQWFHATVSQEAPEGGGVERIPIQNDVLNLAEKAVAGIGQIPGELRHPDLVRLRGDPGDLHGAGLELHDEEDAVADQATQGQYLDGEKVGRRQSVPMSGEERLPGRFCTTRSGAGAMPWSLRIALIVLRATS